MHHVGPKQEPLSKLKNMKDMTLEDHLFLFMYLGSLHI